MKTPLFFILFVCLLLSACSGNKYLPEQDSAPKSIPPNMANIPNATPKFEAKSRGGNPASYQVFGKTYYVLQNSDNFLQRGTASWYGTKFHGRKTSNGETYNMYAMSAAHKTLPIPTYLEVTNLANGKKVIVRVNDRGPFHGDRIIDLSYVAAAKLDILSHGTGNVEIRAVGPNSFKKVPKVPVAASIKKPAVAAVNTQPTAATPQTNNALYIQIGAFKNQQNAQKVKNSLSQSGLTLPHISNKQNTEHVLYIVRTGPYQSVQQADEDRLKIQQLGISSPHYIRQ